ncbi:MAG: CPBP family intramembrane metalloprotease [Anaerolineales bacterium]|nr:CPBP family intramembrane metalloprotease [Anaerolineales bacterium]
MIEKKQIYWFLGITLALSWPLFLAPLALNGLDAQEKVLVTQGLWALAMWAPGLAAIVVTLFVAKKPFSSLRLNALGPKRYYLWAWFLPLGLTVLSGAFTVWFGIGKLDLNMTNFRASLPASISANVALLGLLFFTILVAPFINMLFALGEELGWRGFLLPQLLPLGQWKAVMWSGLIWGLWHAPAIVQGLNYPGHPILGILMMIVFCSLLGVIFAWLYLNTRSPWVAALAHGAVNAVAGLPVLFLKPGFNIAWGGTLAAPTAWIGMALFIAWLAWTKRFPVSVEGMLEKTESAVG